MLQLLDGLGRVLATSGEADLYDLNDDTEIGGDDAKKVYAKPKNGDPVTAYVKVEDLPTHETVTIPQNFAGLDSVAVPTRLRYQLFTITKVSEQDDYVEVVATHIFYEQLNNFTMWEPETLVNYSCGAICRNILQNQIGNDGGFRVATDCTEEVPWHQIDYARKNIVEAFLNPEDGICTRFNLSMIRDNMDFYVLKNVGYDRGMVIEDGLNLLGIEREENIENVITRVAAYGRDSDGDLVWLNNNGNRYVDSTHINDYARPRVELYDTGIQITGQKEAEELHEQGRDNEIVTADNINAKILAKAQERFSEDEVDVPEVTMNIDFVSLGDTEEYKQYRDLDKVFLYDIVHVKDKRRGYNYSAQVIGVEHDVLTGALLSVTIGNLTTWDGVRKVANWQVPEIDGSIIRLHSITSSQYAYESITTEAIKDNSVTGEKVNVQSVSQALDLNSIKSILAQAGLVLDDDGILIYQTSDDNMLKAMLNVQANRITAEVTRATGAESSISGQLVVEAGKVAMVVGTNSGGNFIKAAEIATAINNAGEGIATINAAKVNISATSTLHSLAGAIEEDDQGNVTIVSAGGMRVRKTSGGTTAEFGVFDNDNLTAGVIVDKVNNGTVTLKGSKVWVGDAATDQTLKKWATESDGLFAQNIGALSARIGTIEADYITADDITANKIRALVDGGTFSSLTTTSLTVGGQSIAPNTVVGSCSGTVSQDGTVELYFTRPGGSPVKYLTFSRATLATITGSWSGATYTASAKKADGTVVATVSTTASYGWNGNNLEITSELDDLILSIGFEPDSGTGAGTGGTVTTVDTFDNSHLAYARVLSDPNDRVYHRFRIDATSVWNSVTPTQMHLSDRSDWTYNNKVYNIPLTITCNNSQTNDFTAIVTATEAFEDGADTVTLSAGWNSGSTFTVTASNGETRSTTIATGSGQNGWVLTNDRLYHNVYADGSPRLSDSYDLSDYKQDAIDEGVDSVTLTSGWQGSTFTATASNGATRSTTIATGSGQNGWVLSNDRVYHHVYADGAARLSDDYDLSSYKATQRAAGAASVTVSAAGWQGGSNVVSASNGESVTISMPAVTLSSSNWVSHKKTVYAYSSAAGIQGYIASHEVDATDEYNAGWLAYYNSSKWQRPRAGNGGVCAIPNTTPDGAIRTWFTVTVTTSQTYNSTDHTYTATGTAYDGSAAIASGSSTTGTEAYTAGYNKGWDDAVAKMSRSGANIYGPSASSRGSSELWYAVTVVQGSIGATRVTSSQYTLKASATAYINRVSVATDSTSRGLTV